MGEREQMILSDFSNRESEVKRGEMSEANRGEKR